MACQQHPSMHAPFLLYCLLHILFPAETELLSLCRGGCAWETLLAALISQNLVEVANTLLKGRWIESSQRNCCPDAFKERVTVPACELKREKPLERCGKHRARAWLQILSRPRKNGRTDKRSQRKSGRAFMLTKTPTTTTTTPEHSQKLLNQARAGGEIIIAASGFKDRSSSPTPKAK